MSPFDLPKDLVFNTAKVADPKAFAEQHHAGGWLYLNGEEFNSMEGGMSYAQVQAAVPKSANVISDPPQTLSVELARRHVKALDELPRPTLVTCRAGPRASAVAYLYAGLKAGAGADEVLSRAKQTGAPFCAFDDYVEWVRMSLTALRSETNTGGNMNPNQALWEKGDFTEIATFMREAGEAVVGSLGLQAKARRWSASTSRETWSQPATRGRKSWGSTT